MNSYLIIVVISATFATGIVATTNKIENSNENEIKLDRPKRQYCDYFDNYYAHRVFWPYPIYTSPYRRNTRPTRASIDVPLSTTLRYYSIWDISRKKRYSPVDIWMHEHQKQLQRRHSNSAANNSRRRRSIEENTKHRSKRQNTKYNQIFNPDYLDSSINQQQFDGGFGQQQQQQLPFYSMWDIS